MSCGYSATFRDSLGKVLFAEVFLAASVAVAQSAPTQIPGPPLHQMPETFSSITLRAINDPSTGRGAFSFQDKEDPPVIHIRPGNTLHVTYINAMSTQSPETCVDGPCTNMSNLHFHGLHVSPDTPQDDVLSMMAAPGQSLQYAVEVPPDQPPGLYWYHTHPHGESYQQDLDGMSGALIVDGIERYAPEVSAMPQQVLVLRDAVLKAGDSDSPAQIRRVAARTAECASPPGPFERIFTVNSTIRPSIGIMPGERQFWRIVNTSPDLYADLRLSRGTITVIARDGMPLSFHDRLRGAVVVDHVLLPPGGRIEGVVTGPPRGVHATLISRCVATGPDGDPNPEMVLADLVAVPTNTHPVTPAPGPVIHHSIPTMKLTALEHSKPEFTVVFTEDKQGFYINGKKFTPNAAPMITEPIGDFHHWRVVNQTHEAHPFHIHQVHFLPYAQDGVTAFPADWLDTVNVPPGATIEMVMDFTDPIIRGMSVFHCHLLKHEDKGMMAKILFVDAKQQPRSEVDQHPNPSTERLTPGR